jgi:hypothetical protein
VEVVDSAAADSVAAGSADILAADLADIADQVLEALAALRRAALAGRAVSIRQGSAVEGSIKEWATSLPRRSRVE